MPVHERASHTAQVIPNVILHLINELPVVADLEDLPAGGDRSVRCTNIRTVDGKRPSFVHDPKSTFVFPWHLIRLLELPVAPTEAQKADTRLALSPQQDSAPEFEVPDEEPDEDLLARIRSV